MRERIRIAFKTQLRHLTLLPYTFVIIARNVRNIFVCSLLGPRYDKGNWQQLDIFYIVRLVRFFGERDRPIAKAYTIQLSIQSDKTWHVTIWNPPPSRTFYFEPRFTCQNFRWSYLISCLFSNHFRSAPLQGVVFLSISDLSDAVRGFSCHLIAWIKRNLICWIRLSILLYSFPSLKSPIPKT
jgi:hypothetical protein